jgi:FkbM family methyltransferase
LGKTGYDYLQFRAKWRDIEFQLVEEQEMALLPTLLKPEDTCIDIGANFAYYTVRLARLCPKGKVVAYEPIPSTFKIADKIIKKEGASNVRLYNLGVGEKAATLVFELPLQEIGTPSAGQAHMTGRDNKESQDKGMYTFTKMEKVSCQVVALEEHLSDLERLDFVKIDIEGAELFALKGMKKLLDKFQPMILIELCAPFMKGFGYTTADLVNLMKSHGYALYKTDTKGKLQKLNDLPTEDRNYFFLSERNRERWEPLV